MIHAAPSMIRSPHFRTISRVKSVSSRSFPGMTTSGVIPTAWLTSLSSWRKRRNCSSAFVQRALSEMRAPFLFYLRKLHVIIFLFAVDALKRVKEQERIEGPYA